MENKKTYHLWLITMPIGHYEDLTLRARKKLEKMTLIWCEDTRSFREFCKKIGLEYKNKTLISFHDHSENSREKLLLEHLQTSDVAYVSEAGSPYISDPAHRLVQTCIDHHIPIKSCSGISSVIMGLELSGLPALPFTFHGFLPRNEGGKEKIYQKCLEQGGTHLFFEGVSRVIKTLEAMVGFFPDKTEFALMRELSKPYETVYRFHKKNWEKVRETIVEKGEFVIGLYLEKGQKASYGNIDHILQQMKTKGAKPKLVSKLISELTGEGVKDVYGQYF